MLVFPAPTAPCFREPPFYQAAFSITCYRCLEQWAVCHIEGQKYFQLNSELCPSCAYGEDVDHHYNWRTPGSVLASLMRWLGQERFEDSQEYIREVLDSLPPDVIRSEFNTAIKAFTFHQEPSYLL